MFFNRSAYKLETIRGRVVRRHQILQFLYFLIIQESGEQIALVNIHCQLGEAGLAGINDVIEISRTSFDSDDNWQCVSLKIISFFV